MPLLTFPPTGKWRVRQLRHLLLYLENLKIRARKFDGRCAKHKGYSPAVDGPGGIRGACTRCGLLFEIWEASLHLNALIRRFNPNHDDLKRLVEKVPAVDPRQMSLIVE